MRIFILILTFIGTACFLISCIGTNTPDVKTIGQDLGITLPQSYKLIDSDSDPFGLGADANITYVFQFDSLNYLELIKSIEGSVLFNTATKEDFNTLSVDRKRSIIETMAHHKISSYWIKSDSDYVYDGNALIINDPDRVYVQMFNRGVFLPNQDGAHAFSNNTPVHLYTIRAKVDRKKRILYYNYVHI